MSQTRRITSERAVPPYLRVQHRVLLLISASSRRKEPARPGRRSHTCVQENGLFLFSSDAQRRAGQRRSEDRRTVIYTFVLRGGNGGPARARQPCPRGAGGGHVPDQNRPASWSWEGGKKASCFSTHREDIHRGQDRYKPLMFLSEEEMP